MGNFDVGDGDADVFASLPADHLAVRNVLPQILADFAAHNLLEALLVVIDGPGHCLTFSFPRSAWDRDVPNALRRVSPVQIRTSLTYSNEGSCHPDCRNFFRILVSISQSGKKTISAGRPTQTCHGSRSST